MSRKTKCLAAAVFILFLSQSLLASTEKSIKTLFSSPNALYSHLKVKKAFTVPHKLGPFTGWNPVQWPDRDTTSAGDWNIYDNNQASPVGGAVYTNFFQSYHLNSSLLYNATKLFPITLPSLRTQLLRGYSHPFSVTISAIFELAATQTRTSVTATTGIPGPLTSAVRLYLDGAPLVFLMKEHIYNNGNPTTYDPIPGQVIVNGDAVAGANPPRLVVGKASESSKIMASLGPVVTSSRNMKYDIQYLDVPAYGEMLGHLKDLNIVSFRYKGDADHSKKTLGFIAEQSPDLMTNKEKTAVNLSDTLGLLMASAKGIHNENIAMKKRLEELGQ